MQNKKRFVVIAIILFIFLGLTIFTFANPADKQIKELGNEKDISEKKDPKGDNNKKDDEEKEVNVDNQTQETVNNHGVVVNNVALNERNQNNNTTDPEKNNKEDEDNSYENALNAVKDAELKLDSDTYSAALDLVNNVKDDIKKKELNDRLTEVKNSIDVRALVVTLESKTNSAANKLDMDNARDYRTVEEIVNKVSNLSNETLKDELELKLENLSKLLDDTTPASRVYSTIRESATMKLYENNGNKDYYIKNNDSFVFAISYSEELKSNPIAVIGGREVELVLNEKVKEQENKYLYEGKFEIASDEKELAEGLLEITIKNVVDLAFNESTEEAAINQTRTSNGRSVIYDVTAPKFNFNNGQIVTDFTVKVDDANFDYMTVTNMKTGMTETITTAEYVLPNENTDNLRYDIIAYDKAGNVTKKLNIYVDNTNPTIEGTGIVGSEETELVNNGVYKSVTLNVKDGSLKKIVRVTENGEEVLAEIDNNYNTNLVMSYENTFDVEGTYVIKAIDRMGNYNEITFTVDQTPAKVLASNILVLGDANEQKEFYATNGDTIYAYIRLSEKLANAPLFRLNNNGKSYDVADVTVSDANDNGEYTYSIKYLINKDVDMTDGEITISVSGINDLALNNTNDVVKPTNGHRVYLDRTAPEVVSVSQVYEDKENGRIKATVVFSEKVEFPVGSLNWRKVSDTEYYTYFYRTKDYTVNFKDLADNLSSYTISVDKTAPEVVSVDQVYEDKEDGRIKTTVVFSEPVHYPFDSLNWRRVSDIEYFTYFYRTKNYTINFKDIIGNPNSYTINVDKDTPVVKLFMKGKQVEAGKWYTTTLKAYIEDANEYTAILKDHNGNEKEYISGTDIYDRANYTLEVTDKIGNKTVIEFGIDKDTPAVYLNNGKKNEKISSTVQYFNKDVEVKVVDLNLTSIVLTKDGKEVEFENNSVLTEEGSYVLVATDKANLKTQVNFVIDKTYPTITVSNGTVGDGVYSKLNLKMFDANTVAKVVINGTELTHKGKYVDINDGDAYRFIEGENVVEITDKAGNVTTQTFIVDKTAPEYKAMAILPASSTGVAYAKNGTRITLNVQFYEKLATKPELKINGKVVENAFNNGVQRGEIYIYTAYYTVSEEDQDGEVQVEVYGYADKAGNEGKTLTNEQLNIGGQKKVIIDRTAPVITLNGDSVINLTLGDEYIENNATVTDNIDAEISNLAPAYINWYTLDGVFHNRVSSVNTNEEGRYNLVYYTTDSALNESVKVTRMVYVRPE